MHVNLTLGHPERLATNRNTGLLILAILKMVLQDFDISPALSPFQAGRLRRSADVALIPLYFQTLKRRFNHRSMTPLVYIIYSI